MKRLRILVILFTVLLFMSGCTGRVCPVGSWKLIRVKDGESIMDASALEENGRSGYLVMKEDGSGVLRLDGADNDVVWQHGFIELNGALQRCVMDKEILQIGDRNSNMRFEAWDGVLPPPDAGYWVLTGYGEETYPIAENESIFYIVLNEDGSGYLYFAGDKADFTWEPGVIHEESDLYYTLDGTVMHLDLEGTDVTFEKSMKPVPELTETFGYSDDEEVWFYYLYEYEYDGEIINGEELQNDGISSLIMIFADGSGFIELNGEVYMLSYDDTYMYIDGESAEYTIVDDGFELRYDEYLLKYLYFDPDTGN